MSHTTPTEKTSTSSTGPNKPHLAPSTVEEIQQASRPIRRNSKLSRELRERRQLDAKGLSDEGLVRSLRAKGLADERLKRWDNTALTPLYDADGLGRGFKARSATDTQKVNGLPGVGLKGLVMANELGRCLLNGSVNGQLRAVVIVEGEVDLWTWSQIAREHTPGLAVFGTGAGLWSDAIALKIAAQPVSVFMRCDPGDAGDQYHQKLGQSLTDAGAQKLFVRGPTEGDENDRWRRGELNHDPAHGCVPWTPFIAPWRHQPLPFHSGPDPVRVQAWFDKVLPEECSSLASMTAGKGQGANHKLNATAYLFGRRLHLDGAPSRLEVENALIEAARSTGMQRRRAQDTVKSGLDDGASKPLDGLPEREPRPQAKLGNPAHQKTPRHNSSDPQPARLANAQEPAHQRKGAEGEGGDPTPVQVVPDASAPERPLQGEWDMVMRRTAEDASAEVWPDIFGDVDLSDRLRASLSPAIRSEVRPITTNSETWLYNPPTGLYRVLELDELERMVHRWNGSEREGGKRLAIGQRHVDGALKVLRSATSKRDFFEEAAAGIACTNGFLRLDMTSGAVTLEPLSADHRARWRLECAYDPKDDGALLANYRSTVHAGADDEDDRLKLMGELIGAALFGLGAYFQRAALLYGEGGCGKSTFVELLGAMLPPEAQSSIAPHEFGDDKKALKLEGKVLNAVTEVSDYRPIDKAMFKAIVSGEMVSMRGVYQHTSRFRPRALHVFAGNDLPAVRGANSAFWDRWIALKFDVRFRGSSNEIKHLGQTIANEELATVLAWGVEGVQRLIHQGHFTSPPSASEVFERWRDEGDPVNSWLTECCSQPDPNDRLRKDWPKVSVCFEHFRRWAAPRNEDTLTVRSFAKLVRSAGILQTDSGGKRFNISFSQD